MMKPREISIHDVVQVDHALGRCVRSSPAWLEQAILKADAAREPVHTLVFLIPKVEDGESLWRRIKRVAFEKVRPEHYRSLAVCVAHFQDQEEIAWLKEQVNRPNSLAAPMARKGLYLLSPEDAFQPIEPEALLELELCRSWWLPPLQLEYPQETARLLLQTIRAAQEPWRAAGFFDGRENWMSREILDLLLDATNDLVVQQLSGPELDDRDPLYRPFRRLGEIARLGLLETLWERSGGAFEKNLTAWLIREGPENDRGRRLTPEAGLAVLAKLSGPGIAQVANSYLERAANHWGRYDAFNLALRASDEKTIDLLRRVAFMEEEHPIISRTRETYPLDQREALQVLAALGHDDIVVEGVVRWGLLLPPDFSEYLDGRILDDTKLKAAFESLVLDPIPPGAILALGMSGRSEMAPRILSVLSKLERESPQALACIIALEILEDQSEETENAFRRALDIPDHHEIAQRAFDALTGLRSKQTEEGRIEEAKLIWEKRNDWRFLFDQGEDLELLAYLAGNEEVRSFLSELAASESAPGRQASAHFAAIRALRKIDPASAFDAALIQIERGPEGYRKEYPKLLVEVDPARAERALSDLLRKSEDFNLIYAIGEALDRTAQRPMLLQWLGNPDPKLREGACFAAEAMRWGGDLDQALFALRRAKEWDVWEAAWAALEKLRLQKEVDNLVEAFHQETNRARCWCLLDAALDLGHPGVVAGYGRFGWFAELNRERLPYVMRKYALERLEKRREDLVKKLKDRKKE
jgi:hypothetical protein